MSMIGEHLRVTPAELARALRDSEGAFDFVDRIVDAEDESKPGLSEARHFDTYKAWDLLRYLLERSGFPVDVIHGEDVLIADDDWGYGPPRYLSAERVAVAAAGLGRTPYDQLLSGVTVEEVAAADVYPVMWNEPSALEFGRYWYDRLTRFYEVAAAAGDAMIMWLD
jgi:Domain of unknown function (DUF1877)